MKNIRIHIAYLLLLLLIAAKPTTVIIDAIGTYSTTWQLGKDGNVLSNDTTFASSDFIEQDAFAFKNDTSFVSIAASEMIVNYGDPGTFHFVIPTADTVKASINSYFGDIFKLNNDTTLVPMPWAELKDSLGI